MPASYKVTKSAQGTCIRICSAIDTSLHRRPHFTPLTNMRLFPSLLAALPLLSSFTSALSAKEELQIRTLLSQFALQIDRDDFTHLDTIFTPDVYVDYFGRVSHGLAEFGPFLKRGLSGVTQHAISSTVIEDHGHVLNSTAYVTAAFLGPGKNGTGQVGDVVTLYGEYVDGWVRQGREWRINRRIVNLFNPGFVGNPALIPPP